MGKYIIRRSLQAIPVIFLIAVVSFLLMQAAPGGPAARVQPEPQDQRSPEGGWLARWCLEQNPDARRHAARVRRLDGRLELRGRHRQRQLLHPVQGLPNFLPACLGGGNNGVLHGDFGYSIFTGRPVLDMIGERVPATLVLMITAFVIWVTVAIVIGVIAAVKRYSLFDQAVTFFSYIFYSLPTFWLGLILIFIFAVGLRWVPPQGIVDTRGACGAFNTAALLGLLLEEPGRQRCLTSGGT